MKGTNRSGKNERKEQAVTRPLCSVVMATYNRGHLLRRSLEGYERHDFDNRELELVVVDDGSTDDTQFFLREWSRRTKVRTVVLTPHPKDRSWRDCGAVLNYGIRMSSGEHVLITHPEVIPGRKSVSACVSRLGEYEDYLKESLKPRGGSYSPVGVYACCRVYYLSQKDQERIETVPWRTEGNLAVRQIVGFYTDDVNGHPDFRHEMTDIIAKPNSRIPSWESWVFGGFSRKAWSRLGGMLETQEWGSVDVAFMHRRKVLGIPNSTQEDDETIVIHQNHDDPSVNVPTPRVESVWRRELLGMKDVLDDPKALLHPAVDNLGWYPAL